MAVTENENTPTNTAKETTTQAEVRQKSKWRWLWRGLLLLLVLIISPIIFLATGTGQRTALEWADKWLDELQIGKIEGSLQDGLSLYDTQFKMDGVAVEVGQADLHIGFGCLFDRRACVEKMAVKDSNIVIDTAKLPKSPDQPERKPLGDIRLPIGVSLNQFSLDNVKLSVDEIDIVLHHFHSGITGQGQDLALMPTELNGLSLSLAPQAIANPPKSAKAEPAKAVDWQGLKQQLAQPLLTKLDPIKLPLNLAISELKARDIRISQKVRDSETATSLINVELVDIQAHSDHQKVELAKLAVHSDKGNVAGQGQLTLSDNYPLQWTINATVPALNELKIPASQAELSLSGELFGVTMLTAHTKGVVDSTLQGQVHLAEPKTPFQLALKSEAVRYPFMLEKDIDPLQLSNLNFKLTGDLLNYQLHTSLDAKGMGLPESRATLEGKGELTQFELSDLILDTLQGKVSLVGKVDWHQGVEWQSQIRLDNIYTKSILPDWPAQLSGGFRSEGYAGRGEKSEAWSVSVLDMDLRGQLLQKNLQLKGAFTADHQTLLNVANISLIYGVNTINLAGIIGEKSDFNAQINAPNLQGLVPNLNASMQGKIKLLGNIREPSLDLDLTANNVAYDQFKLQHLTAKGQVGTPKEISGNLELALRQLAFGEIKVNNANLVASGSERQHHLKLTSSGDPVGVNLQISGSFDRLQQKWQGQLSNVAIQSPVGEWQNDKAIGITYHNPQLKADISAHCWRNPKLNLCFPQAFSAGQEGRIPFEIKQFDLTMVQPFLDPASQISGHLTAKGDAGWFKTKSPEVNLELHSSGLKLSQKVDYRTFPLNLSPVKITAKLANDQLNLNTDVKIENNGRLTSQLVMKDIANKRTLSGNIQLEKLNLTLLAPLLSSGEKVDGEINARLTMGGNVLSPLLYGSLNLAGLRAKSNAMPFDITGGGLDLNFNGARSTLKGNVQTKESNLVLSGDANWQNIEAWHTRIKAQANRFRVDIPNIAKVDVSPDIEVKATPKELILGGKVDIPWARISVEELPDSAVGVSSDEVIMDGSAKNKTAARQKLQQSSKNMAQNGAGMAIKADIAVNVGDDVRIDAYGLKSELNGTVKVSQGNKGLGLYGQIYLKNGTFASFGQDLVIRKGMIAFTGLPSQPTLDFEAIRNPEAIEDTNVTAGVKVTGIADAPEVKLFSTPSMSQDRILSYILTGRDLENSGDGSSSNSVTAALLGLGLSKSSKMVGGVGSAFGISDLSVTTAGIGDNTKVVVSGALTPKFKVKYGVGIFAPLTELTLRYRLAPSLYLQWVSSINNAVDLMYRFEFD